ncbi:MAG: glutamate formiminotransferase, partial [Defluviitaleaceae bacterium]|nr:glutamate formiminotransferase [Defluviitaleaceae bacterium]
LSKEVAEEVSKNGLPVFLYEETAMAIHGKNTPRANLATLRKGEFEGMAEKIKEEKFKPDYGTELHKTAGIVAIGARMPLIAFNVNLSTSDVEIANKIAKLVRGLGGGLKYCKAIGVALNETTAQVSMNLTNYEKTPIYRALELVKIEAKRYGVTVIGTELIGLAPMDALIDSAIYYMQVENYEKTAVLESRF